jgi:uncharacterized coiled-coil protein SlyX
MNALIERIHDLERQISLAQDLIAVLNKASQDWLEGEQGRLAELDDLKSQISLRDAQIQSLRKDVSRLSARLESRQGGSRSD